MRTWRTRRISRSEADRLIAGEPTGPRHSGLTELLSAASAPATARERSGERAAVAAFVRARRAGAPDTAPVRDRRRRVPRSGRAATVRVAAATAVLVAGGTAAFAKTGQLPGGAQQRAHSIFASLGVPAPPAGHRTPAASGPASARPSAAAGGRGAGDARAALALCRSWAAVYLDRHGHPRNPPPGQALPARTLRALAAAAGGERDIPGYCAAILAGDGHDRPSHPAPPAHATPPAPPHGATQPAHPTPPPDPHASSGAKPTGGDWRGDDARAAYPTSGRRRLAAWTGAPAWAPSP
jgi:hypothetical protein